MPTGTQVIRGAVEISNGQLKIVDDNGNVFDTRLNLSELQNVANAILLELKKLNTQLANITDSTVSNSDVIGA